jgi:hypothetical protein
MKADHPLKRDPWGGARDAAIVTMSSNSRFKLVTRILDFYNGQSQSGFGHPSCKGGNNADNIIKSLAKDFPTGPKSH